MDISSPNVLLLLVDQERYDVSAPDGVDVETPNIDRLRQDGMTFTRAYTPTSICASARASLLSGYYPHTHGMLNDCHKSDAIIRNLPAEISTVGEHLQEAGYRSTFAGRWLVGADQTAEDFGFEPVTGDGTTEDDSAFRAYQRAQGIDPDAIELSDQIYTTTPEPELVAAKTSTPPEGTRIAYYTEKTIESLSEHAQTTRPFFHLLDFARQHQAYVVPEPYASMYDPTDIVPWENFREAYGAKPQVQKNYLEYRGVTHLEWDDWAEAAAKYFGFISFVDAHIGRVLDAIDELGLENTAVVHTADHGDFTGGHRQFNKGPMMYEEAYHIPLMIRWPELVESGVESEHFVRLLDLMPTVLEMADHPVPDDIHGRSLVPLLRGEDPPDWPTSLFAEYHGSGFGLYSQRMVRTDEYKYVYNTPDIDELYDLSEDPSELHNLIDDPDYRAIRAELKRELLEWMERTDDMIRQWSRQVLAPGEHHD